MDQNSLKMEELYQLLLDGWSAGRFFERQRDPQNLARYSSFVKIKKQQAETAAAVLQLPPPTVPGVRSKSETSLLKSEARLASEICKMMDAAEILSTALALDTLLRLQLDGLSALGEC